jgi:transposase
MKKQNLPVKSDTGATPESSSAKPRKTFSDQFKRDAVARFREDGVNASLLAVELGIRRNQLYKWEKALATLEPGAGLRSPGRPPVADESEVTSLRRKLAKAEQELAILKKFDAYLTRLKK